MDENGKRFLKAYLDLPENQRLKNYLSKHTLENLQHLPAASIPTHFTSYDPIEKIHWSWFLPILERHADEEKKILIASLPGYAAQSIENTLSIRSERTLSQLANQYIRNILYESLFKPERAPLRQEFLPLSTLTPLLELNKKELLSLINYLSLFDLAVEIRQIVETKILKKLYSLLEETEVAALKQISMLKEAGPLSKMGLDKWDGSEETLRHLLHRRGLQKLAIGLSGAPSDFVWHIAHVLDSGRGGSLLKLTTAEKAAQWSDTVIRQIEEWLKTR